MLGLRDRLRGILGRERPAGEGAPAARHAADRPPLVLAAAPRIDAGPRPVATSPPGAVALRLDDAVAFEALGAWARAHAPGSAVVVTHPDPERAAAAAERLFALGLSAAWLASTAQEPA